MTKTEKKKLTKRQRVLEMTGIQLEVIKRQFERLESNFKLMLGVNEALSLRIAELEALHDFELPVESKPKAIIAKRYKAKARERK